MPPAARYGVAELKNYAARKVPDSVYENGNR
jgi:hypothetical protein